MTLEIRPFEPTEQEYEAVVALMNIHFPLRDTTLSGLREFDQLIVTETVYARFVGLVDDRVAAISTYGQPPRLRNTDKYLLEFELHPDHDCTAFVQDLYDHLVTVLRSRKAIAAFTETSETNSARIGFLEKQGFEVVQRDYSSVLDVTTFEPTAHHLATWQNVQNQQITIYALAQLQQNDANWLEKLADLMWAYRQDIPSTEPPVRETMTQFQKKIERSSFRADAWFVAIDETDGQYVGLTNLWVDHDQPEKMQTGQTGVLRSHRRRGIATALKLKSLEFAKQLGAKNIPTNNEANNPMFQLNLSLGFKPKPALLEYQKIFSDQGA